MIDPIHDRRTPISPQLAWRVAIMGFVVLALFAVVFFRLWYLQVLSGDQYLAEANDNRVRDERIQAPRGEIVDRQGRKIVTNRQAIVVELSPARLPEAERRAAARWGQLAGQRERRKKGEKGEPVPIPPIPDRELAERYRSLARVLNMSGTEIHRRVIRSLAIVPYSAVRVRTDVPRSVLNYLRERRTAYPGVEAAEVFVRKYPQKTLAAQLLGTVGEVSPRQLKQRKFRGVKQGTIVGQEGLEVEYDRYLRGNDGSRRIQVDAFGNPKGQLRELEPEAGNQLKLSLDLDLQRAGQAALSGAANAGGNPAAFVAMNPRNGEILAMGSYPSFDPNVLSGKPLTQKQVDRLFGEEAGAPRFNRAISGLYPTGSIFKPLSATAALESGVIGIDQPIADNGCTKIGNLEKCNAGKVKNGSVAVRKALQVSSDIYFYRVGASMYSVPGKPLQSWVRKYGIGRRTGIDLPGEFRGLVPDQAWRTRVNKEETKCRRTNKGKACYVLDIRPYNPGDNANLAVGQGELQATPLQMAVAYSALANDGRVPRPHLGLEIEDGQGEPIQRIERQAARRFKIDPGYREAIMDGLRSAAMEPGGTSYDVFKDFPRDLTVYGKTGTAERQPQPDQSWYVAYVPGARGRSPIVVAATVESCGCFGAEAAAPIVRLILSKHFGVKPKLVKGESKTL